MPNCGDAYESEKHTPAVFAIIVAQLKNRVHDRHKHRPVMYISSYQECVTAQSDSLHTSSFPLSLRIHLISFNVYKDLLLQNTLNFTKHAKLSIEQRLSSEQLFFKGGNRNTAETYFFTQLPTLTPSCEETSSLF